MSNVDAEPHEFSLVLGGPLYRFWQWTGLLCPPLGRVWRRTAAVALVTWLPLLVLSLLDRTVADGGILFLKGLGAHARLLLAVPILIAAEGPIHSRLASTIRRLVDCGIVPPAERPKLNALIRSTHRVRDSLLLESGLLIAVYTLGHWAWRDYWACGRTTWYAVAGTAGWHLTPAGFWYAFVSVPVFQFFLLRWIFRLGLWTWFLVRVARLDLRLIPTHPDRAGGIGCLGNSAYPFGLLLMAAGTLWAGQIGQRILFEGHSLLAYKMDIVLAAVLLVALVLAPLTAFTPLLIRTKLRGRSEYGFLANRYVTEFDTKWVRHSGPADERLIGSPDIQSLADMANSYSVVQSMRSVPFGTDLVTFLFVACVAPLLPLTLTVVPFDKMIDQFIKGIL